ncbi:MAG: HD domain-containing protein [Longimicrobiales bacterium]|nr:HD domain-containing protein [Longimicrobiales bacterium]
MSSTPIIDEAAEGTLPGWAVAGPERREHMVRVAELLDVWTEALTLPEEERRRWRAAGHLHDALRDADPDALRSRVPPALRTLPGALLHGPAAAERLRVDGVEDGELLDAVSFHTVGSPTFRTLGRALYAADFLEPGRPYRPDWRAELRGRMPGEMDAVVREILRARIRHRLDTGHVVLPRTWAFWNTLVEEGP